MRESSLDLLVTGKQCPREKFALLHAIIKTFKHIFYFVLFLGMFLWAVTALLSFNSFLFLFLFVCFLFLCGLWLNNPSFVALFQMLFYIKAYINETWCGG